LDDDEDLLMRAEDFGKYHSYFQPIPCQRRVGRLRQLSAKQQVAPAAEKILPNP
jgi:hypothetical protein